jgi:hypothetical protein
LKIWWGERWRVYWGRLRWIGRILAEYAEERRRIGKGDGRVEKYGWERWDEEAGV